MKRVKVYPKLVKIQNKSLIVKPLRISLARTFLFNYDGDNDIYYRKERKIKRRMNSIGVISNLKLKSINLNPSKYKDNIHLTMHCFTEYFDKKQKYHERKKPVKDIVAKERKVIELPDSLVKKYNRNEIINMHFEDNKNSLSYNFNMVDKKKQSSSLDFVDKKN